MKPLAKLVAEGSAYEMEIVDRTQLGELVRCTSVNHTGGPWVSFWVQPVDADGHTYYSHPPVRIATVEVDPSEVPSSDGDSLAYQLRAAKEEAMIRFWDRLNDAAVLFAHEAGVDLVSGDLAEERS